MKFTQSRAAFFAAANHFSGRLRKQNFTAVGSKTAIVRFRSIFLFFRSVYVAVIVFEGSEKRNLSGGFLTSEFACN